MILIIGIIISLVVVFLWSSGCFKAQSSSNTHLILNHFITECGDLWVPWMKFWESSTPVGSYTLCKECYRNAVTRIDQQYFQSRRILR